MRILVYSSLDIRPGITKERLVQMEPILTDSEFWKHLVEEYELGEKLDSIVSNTCASWARITRVSTVESSTASIVLLDNKISLEISRPVADGDNFMSQVFRLHATMSDNEYQCFIKVLPQHPFSRKVASMLEYYQKEICMYSNIFPYLHDLLTDAHLNPSEYLQVPNLYYANLSLNDSGLPTSKTILVMEDLSLRGFRMADKVQGCDLNQAKCAMRSLAFFHASSNIMLRKLKARPEISDILEIFMKTAPEATPSSLAAYKGAVQRTKQAVEQMGYPIIANKLDKEIENIAPNFSREMPEQSGILACLNHGDYWTNNLLFQYDPVSGLPVAPSMVDWQMAAVGHPATDISFFLTTSTCKSLWRNHWNELLHEYFENLRNLLCQLGLDLVKLGYTETNFLNEFATRIPKSFTFVSVTLPFILNVGIATELTLSELVNQEFPEGKCVDSELESCDLNQRERQNLRKSRSVDALLASRLWRDTYLDIALELIRRGWF